MTSVWLNLRWLPAYWISRAGVMCGRLLPTSVWYFLSDPFADLCFAMARRHRKHLIANLSRVIGPEEAPAAARRVFHNFARYVIDLYQLPSLGRHALHDRLQFNDYTRLDEVLAEKRGIVFVTLHLGQAELGATAMSNYGRPVNAIAERLPTPQMDRFIQGLRSELGISVISATRAKPELLRCLSRGEILAMMFDAVGPGQGMTVDFFGAPAQFSQAPARIALRAGARVVTTVVSRDPNDPIRLIPSIDFDLDFTPTGNEDADVRALTQAIAHSFERFVKQFADQWFAFRPVWPAQQPAAVAESSEPEEERWKLWSLVAAVKLGGLLPRSVAYGMAKLAGDLAYYARKPTRRDVEDNMRHVMGPDARRPAVKTAAREAFRNVARYYVDMIRLPGMTRAELLGGRVRLHGFDRLKSLDAGQGVIVATAHFGNPEMAVQVGALLGLNMLVLAEPLRPPAFARLMQDIRSANGPQYVDVGFSTIAQAMRHLRGGGCLAITVDRDIQDKGSPLPFFGQVTRMPLGAVELAARTGAVILPGFCHRTADGFDVYFEEPLEMVSTGQAKTDALINARAMLERVEPRLRSDPGQWMVLERIWKPVETPIEGMETPAALAQP